MPHLVWSVLHIWIFIWKNKYGDNMNSKSIWNMETEIPRRKPLNKKIKADVCVVGGGMAGVLTAYKLQENGFDVVVLEARSVASGQTGNTTAKLTIQQGEKYTKLIETLGETKARLYAKANSDAIDDFERIIKEKNINCDFQRVPSYLYSLEEDNNIIKEYESAKKIGINCYTTDLTHLPFKVKTALVFRNQAQFNPLKFLSKITEEIKIYENSPVREIKSNLVETESGVVQANHIVIATHYPIVNKKGLFFPRLYQSRSYALALEGGVTLDGMYFTEDREGLSFRNYKNYTIIVGEGHNTGDNPNGDKYKRLRNKVMQILPDSREVARWSAQGTKSIDGLPYIGKYCVTENAWYTATGFGKWGMTLSMVSANLITDLITGRENPYEKLFTPLRFKSSSADNLCKMGGKAIKEIAKEFFSPPQDELDEIEKGQAKVVSYNGEKVGAYRDENGQVHMVSIMCTHMGCQLQWNGDEKSWDCPCHGSRFSYKGELIDNPAQNNLNSV